METNIFFYLETASTADSNVWSHSFGTQNRQWLELESIFEYIVTTQSYASSNRYYLKRKTWDKARGLLRLIYMTQNSLLGN